MYIDSKTQEARSCLIYLKGELLGTVIRIDTELGYFDRKVRQPDGTWVQEHVHFEPGDVEIKFP